jgi:hypothetical protein
MKLPKLPEAVGLCMRVADMPVAIFDGDVIAECGLCGEPIRHRPHMPRNILLICNVCVELTLDQLGPIQ